MKREKSKLIILCLMIFTFSFSLAYAENDKKIYDKKCAPCHGKDGKGNVAMLKMLKVDASLLNLVDKETQDKTDEDLVSIVVKGLNKMPAYGKNFKNEEIKGIVSYIRTLAK